VCGIVGSVAPAGGLAPGVGVRIDAAAAVLRHRGPDELGRYSDGYAALCCDRLAIIDVARGQQPVTNETGSVVAVLNGEIFNHRRLRDALRASGHRFRSACDSEVLVHLYEERGAALVDELDGQFAFAIWDVPARRLLLARDRMGICPLHYHVAGGTLSFASEAKALFAARLVEPRLDEVGFAQAALMNAVVAPRPLFAGVAQLGPAHRLHFDRDGLRIERYWDLRFPRPDERPQRTPAAWAGELSERMRAAVASSLESDVPVGTFLSGGIDSGIVTTLAARVAGAPLPAYSIASSHRRFDERSGAERVSRAVGAPLHTVLADEMLVARSFPALIWHAESPVLSTEAAALLALAQRARRDVKVVLTGEGADEAFAGYANFKQHLVLRPLIERGPARLRRALRPLARRLFGDDFLVPAEHRLDEVHDALGFIPAQLYEHEFYRGVAPLVFEPARARAVLGRPLWADLGIAKEPLAGLHWLDQSLYIGYRVMLPGYLLGAHGDRALMASSIEGRYPFLDRGLVEFAASIPPELKLRRGSDKYVLRESARGLVPPATVRARKRRFMAPFGTPFLLPGAPPEIRALLAPDALRAFGYFDPARVGRVAAALSALQDRGHGPRSDLERLRLGCALTLVASTQLFHHLFIAGAGLASPPRVPAA
jgi:asparagine synthase (glutamine-hydrolysing)